LTQAKIDKLIMYTAEIVDISPKATMDEVAAEFAGDTPPEEGRSWGG
jgi:hypothetical protein